jgi:hypothetical protein
MRNRRRKLLSAGLLSAGLLCTALGGCFSAEVEDASAGLGYWTRDPTYSIGGTVQGAKGVLTLQNSNGTQLRVDSNGAFAFETPMVSSAWYDVTIAVLPRDQTCKVTHGSGTVSEADIRDVVVACH